MEEEDGSFAAKVGHSGRRMRERDVFEKNGKPWTKKITTISVGEDGNEGVGIHFSGGTKKR